MTVNWYYLPIDNPVIKNKQGARKTRNSIKAQGAKHLERLPRKAVKSPLLAMPQSQPDVELNNLFLGFGPRGLQSCLTHPVSPWLLIPFWSPGWWCVTFIHYCKVKRSCKPVRNLTARKNAFPYKSRENLFFFSIFPSSSWVKYSINVALFSPPNSGKTVMTDLITNQFASGVIRQNEECCITRSVSYCQNQHFLPYFRNIPSPQHDLAREHDLTATCPSSNILSSL